MTIETPAVETKVETAATQPETVATPNATQVDYEAVLKQKDDELAQVRTERENYRKGMLKAKGKLPEEDYSDNNQTETQEEMVRRIAREELLTTKETQLQAEKEQLYNVLIKRNKELEVALKNRGQILQTSGQGSNSEKPEAKVDDYLSNDQIRDLKKRGWDDKKIEAFKANARKISNMPK
jgi:hypothetical protein